MRRRFDSGIYAVWQSQHNAHDTMESESVKKNGEVKTSESHYFADSGSVYDFLIDNFEHDIAAEAESWTELASVGDLYEGADFEIEMMEGGKG